MTFVPVQKLCVNIYIYIYIHTYMCMHFFFFFLGGGGGGGGASVSGLNATFFFGLPIVSCSMINSLILGCL